MKLKLTSALQISTAFVALGTVAISAPASAQSDSPWSGFYAGINAGGAFSNSDAEASLSTNPSAPIPVNPITGGSTSALTASKHFDSKHKNTFSGGVELGYNYVLESGILLGIETDFNFYDMKRSGSRSIQSPVLINPPIVYTVNQSIDTDWLWTLRPRVGYTIDKFLIFVSGGIAMTNTTSKASFIDSSNAANSLSYSQGKTRTGWTLGGGGGYAITENISAKVEYLYQDFGRSHDSATSPNGYVTLATSPHFRSHLFRAGVDYRF